MTAFVISNPGTGPIDGVHERDARRNVSALCHDLDLPVPRVRVERRSDADEDGRYGYLLRRGIRSTLVEMPGLPLDRVRLRPGDNAWHFPRLYVDGSSWLWPLAVNSTRQDLLDHDGSAERGYRQSVADCDFVMENEPRCPICGMIKDRYLTDYKTENPPYGYDRLRCLACKPVERIQVRSWNLEAVYVDDSWKELQYGCVYRVTSRRLPYEALGGQRDPICTIAYFSNSNSQCRLRQGHEGQCEPIWKEITRERIDLPYRGAP